MNNNEQLKAAKGWYKIAKEQNNNVAIEILENMFPELKESEDEQHRKWILEYLYDGLRKSDEQFKGQFKAAIAWFEKQGNLMKALQISNSRIAELVEEKYNLEEKLKKQGEQKPNYCHHEVDLSGCSEEYRKGYYDGWNNCNQQHAQLEAEQKPTWSEEDEKMLQGIWDEILANKHDAKEYEWKTYDKFLNWLKSLKDRVQPKQEWSEEDEKMRAAVLQLITDSEKENGWNCVYCNDKEIYFSDIIAWFKSLKDRYTWKPSDEQMNALNTCLIKGEISYVGQGSILQSLYDKLKTL